MYRFGVVVWMAGTLGMSVAQAQTASMAAEVKQSYETVKKNILGSAERMPGDSYGFKPTPDVRSFAEVLDHVAEAQMRVCGGVAGDQTSPNAAGKTSKAEVIAALNEAFAECDKAYDSLTDANAAETMKAGRPMSKLGLLAGNVGHDREQYGILSVYLRLKSIVPPSSDRSSTK